MSYSSHDILLCGEEVVVRVLTWVALDLLQNARVRSTSKTLSTGLCLVPPSCFLQTERSPLTTDEQQLEKVRCKHTRTASKHENVKVFHANNA